MALKGIRVVEMAGLAPAPFCGMILSDFGASVIRVDKVKTPVTADVLARGKRSVAVDLKQEKGSSVVRRLCAKADVLIEPFRPGVMESLGLGPSVLLPDNPRLIYTRLTGFGQTGTYSKMAGHDINYLALSGALSRLGRKHDKPYFPVNLLADFAGGGLLSALGICMALHSRSQSGKGQVIDSNMTEGAAYLSSWLWRSRDLFLWPNKRRGENWLDGGSAFYNTYETSDGKYMAVGAIEPKFYQVLAEKLNLPEDTHQFDDPEEMESIITSAFLKKTQEEWCETFNGSDACVTPVLELDEAQHHEHNKSRESFKFGEPRPAPIFSQTPAPDITNNDNPTIGAHTKSVLSEVGYTQEEINALCSEGIVEDVTPSLKSKL